MNVTLTAEQEELVRSKVASGRYSDVSEVVNQALQLLDDYEREEAFRAAVMIGYDEAERGEGVPWTPELRAELMREARQMAAAGQKPDPDVCP
jgi:antitoxin ParD1/3/4